MASRIREMFSSSKEDPVYRVNYAQHQGTMNNLRFKQPGHHVGPLPVIELRVPMCCEKCKEKVREELESVEGVRDVLCDQFNQRVTVTGYADPLRVLKRVKKVKKKSEFFTQGSYINNRSVPMSMPVPVHVATPMVTPMPVPAPARYVAQPLVRTNSFGRGLTRQPSYGKVTHSGYNHGLDAPSYGKVPHSSYNHGLEAPRDVHRDYYGVRRMPSFKKHRYHDAEYVSMGDQFTPQYGETRYVQQRPHALQSQVSFSKLPVQNPYYVKPMYHEY